jgi:hypothetical protein
MDEVEKLASIGVTQTEMAKLACLETGETFDSVRRARTKRN